MATQPLTAPKQWTTSPRAVDALDKALPSNPQVMPVHTEKWDVSRSDIYVEDRWQPIFAEMRAAGDLHKVTDSPFGSHWNVVSHRAIQHVEALPELYSSERRDHHPRPAERREARRARPRAVRAADVHRHGPAQAHRPAAHRRAQVHPVRT